MALNKTIQGRKAYTPPFKSVDQIREELIAIHANTDISDIFLKLAQYPENAPERKRFFFSAYLFIISDSVLVSSKCKNPDMASLMGTCHKTMFDCWDGNDSLVTFGEYIITDIEKLRFTDYFKHKDDNVDLTNGEQCRIPFTKLLRAAFSVRFELFGVDVQQAYSETNGTVDFETLFLDLAITFQAYVTLNTKSAAKLSIGSFKLNPDYDEVQDTFQTMALKECIATYYNAIIDVFKNQ